MDETLRLHMPSTHPGSVGLALVAEGEDEDYGQNSYDDGEQDTHIVVLLWREIKKKETKQILYKWMD